MARKKARRAVRRSRKNPAQKLMDKKYQIGLVGLAAIVGASVYFADDIKAIVSKGANKAGLGAIGMKNNMGLLSVDGNVRRVNPNHMGAIHANPAHMGMIGFK